MLEIKKEKEVNDEFVIATFAIMPYSRYGFSQINKALYTLYNYINLLHPMTDFKYDILSLNEGKKIKEMLVYGYDNIYVGVSIKSLRIIEGKELDRVMGW